jgi:hypothetical protein
LPFPLSAVADSAGGAGGSAELASLGVVLPTTSSGLRPRLI